MCDYSATAVKHRAAAKGDKLVTHALTSHTRGFADKADKSIAVCLLPGTELRFDQPVRIGQKGWFARAFGGSTLPHTMARFRQVDTNNASTHHDTLEFPDGSTMKLTHLIPGQTATVIQLPVDPGTLQGQARAKAVAEQERAAFV